ncbi:MAG: Gfo/Idh/MocA family oxidoreductase [Ignavibacteria bacterium]|nr:Gfo/Idh/MocA family oxidoreductase [Ignavibacteria bacterium]
MDKLKIGILGLGGVAQVMHLPALTKVDTVEITAVCDRDFQKAKVIGNKYGVKKIYKDLDLMLKECEEVNSVIICTPTEYHEEHAIKCLSAGKNVLVEKPLARNFKEAQKIVEIAEKENKILMVGMNHRFRGDVMLQRSFILAGEMGNLFYIKTGWLKTQSSNTRWFTEKDKSGGGVFLDNGVVMLDLGMWMFGFPQVHSVTGINYFHNTKSVEDSNFTLVRFKNNACLTIEVSWSFLRGAEFYYCNIYGDKGSSSINPLRVFKKMDTELYEITPKTKKDTGAIKSSFEYQLKHFVGAVKGHHKLLSSGKDALKVMQVVDAVYKSAKIGKEIILK